jgi:hypothetical protein
VPEAADGYRAFYAEKLWELIPPYYRDLDGESEPPGALRGLVEVMAEQAAILRRSQDRLWEDQFVERADDWAVPYIGDLVATRLVSALLPRERRVDVAKTVYYRRRAGTLRVLEELIGDITQWEGVVTEGFRRLARAPHGLDPAQPRRDGRWSKTPPGALADLRHPFGAQLTGSAFDEYHRTPEVRAPRGRDGQYGIPRLVFHLFRLTSYRVEGVTPRAFGIAPNEWFTFDPSGRDVPLFARRTRAQALSTGTSSAMSTVFDTPILASAWEEWTSARAWELPAPIPNRLLADVAYQMDPSALAGVFAGLNAAERLALARLYDLRIPSERRLETLLATTTPALSGALQDIRLATLAPDCGKAVLLSGDEPSIQILPDGAAARPVDELQAEDLSDPTVIWASWQRAAIDAQRGRFVLRPVLVAATDPLTDHHVGSPGVFGAGVHERAAIPWADPAWIAGPPGPTTLVSGGGAVPALAVAAGILLIEDSRTYTSAADNTVEALAVRSVDGRRPYISLDADWGFTGSIADSILALDGLWLGASGAAPDVVLQGTWERVEIRASTLDPGGIAADGTALPSVSIRVEGAVERLVIQSSVISQIALAGTGSIQRLEITDSVVQADTAFDLPNTEVALVRSTVLGGASCLRLWASDCLFSGAVEAIDTQNGCFRFCAAHEDSLDHVPHPYQSAFFADASALFVSRTFGDPGYALLSEAPEVVLVASADDMDGQASIHTGASNDGEMGATNALLYPIKARALRAKVEEFMPFGLLPVFVVET